eukprot:IDg4946t1
MDRCIAFRLPFYPLYYFGSLLPQSDQAKQAAHRTPSLQASAYYLQHPEGVNLGCSQVDFSLAAFEGDKRAQTKKAQKIVQQNRSGWCRRAHDNCVLCVVQRRAHRFYISIRTVKRENVRLLVTANSTVQNSNLQLRQENAAFRRDVRIRLPTCLSAGLGTCAPARLRAPHSVTRFPASARSIASVVP